MPPKTLRRCIERALDNLAEGNFNRFRNELVKRQQEPRVVLNRVEKKTCWEVVDVMISNFKEDEAFEVTKELLEEIGFSQEAENMVKEAMKAGLIPAGGAAGAAGAAGAQTEDEHFVDKHREALIQRVSNTGPILDALLSEKVIQQETYLAIRALPTSQDQIRELFCGPLRAAKACKDIFYSVLQEKEPHLIADLNRRK